MGSKMRSTPPASALVTGANRGIGLEFVRQLADAGCKALAACRRPEEAAELDQLAEAHPDRVVPMELDVSSESSIAAIAQALEESGLPLDLLLHNAGTVAQGESGLEGISPEEMRRVLDTNLIGPLLLTRALLPALSRAEKAKVFILTSRTGALRPPPPNDKPGSQFSYAVSKAGIHRAIPILAADLKPRGIAVGGIDPGWVETDMTRGAPTTERFRLAPSESVRGMLNTISKANISETGTLWRWNGEVSRWYAPEETAEERQEVTA